MKIRDSEKKKKKTEKSDEAKPSSKELADDFDKILEELDIENTKKDQTPQIDEQEHLSRMIDEFASDIEPDEPPKPDPGRPPGGESQVPDGEGSSDPKVLKGIEKLKKEATSLHHMMTHIPKNPYCSVCNQAKMYKTPGYKTDGVRSVEASSSDHVVIYRDSHQVIEEARLALVIKDVATSFMCAYPSALKDEMECKSALQHFVSSKDKVGVFYSDNAKGLVRSALSLGWRHEKSKKYIHQSNSMAERAVKATSEGTRCNLLQAGLSHVYWPQALEHACAAFSILHGISDLVMPFLARHFLLDVASTIGLVPKLSAKTTPGSSQLPSLECSSATIFSLV